MSRTLADFLGNWKSIGTHTNPLEDKDGEYPKQWKDRLEYYPPEGLQLEASKATPTVCKDFKEISKVGDPKSPANDDILKFRFTNWEPTSGYNKAIKEKIEAAEFTLKGDVLVSTPLVLSTDLSIIEVIELVEDFQIPGTSDVVDFMRHTLFWSDGLVAKWVCCKDLTA